MKGDGDGDEEREGEGERERERARERESRGEREGRGCVWPRSDRVREGGGVGERERERCCDIVRGLCESVREYRERKSVSVFGGSGQCSPSLHSLHSLEQFAVV